jgi:hypothetical protein|tara:strand:- start:964 stop:1191 length:228 start_codon:yes stop_codon:yes gene_type:complete
VQYIPTNFAKYKSRYLRQSSTASLQKLTEIKEAEINIKDGCIKLNMYQAYTAGSKNKLEENIKYFPVFQSAIRFI